LGRDRTVLGVELKKVFFIPLVLTLFVLAAGFQLFIFTALYMRSGLIVLVDPFPELRLFEFILASAIFTVSCIALSLFFWRLLKPPKINNSDIPEYNRFSSWAKRRKDI